MTAIRAEHPHVQISPRAEGRVNGARRRAATGARVDVSLTTHRFAALSRAVAGGARRPC
jgi:hypothetical protein